MTILRTTCRLVMTVLTMPLWWVDAKRECEAAGFHCEKP